MLFKRQAANALSTISGSYAGAADLAGAGRKAVRGATYEQGRKALRPPAARAQAAGPAEAIGAAGDRAVASP